MSDDEFIISSLKRIYDECEKAQENTENQTVLLLPGIAEKYNDTLGMVKERNPDNDIIKQLDEIEPKEPVDNKRNWSDNYEKIQNIKINVSTIADFMGVEMNGFQNTLDRDGMPIVQVTQNQNVSQKVGIENVIDQVNSVPMKDHQREELEELVRVFQKHVEKETADPSKLKSLYGKIAEYSESIALQLGIYTLQQGIDIVFPK
ncbi:hypothetical protein [Natrinema soli]|uniref:Uncharacterized protein n=1 Tax=Natrinema soli TaxID=1930624 RepID=A0ABD5SZD0_9EURY|nr:hypothetical protein [Natrinema soli]